VAAVARAVRVGQGLCHARTSTPDRYGCQITEAPCDFPSNVEIVTRIGSAMPAYTPAREVTYAQGPGNRTADPEVVQRGIR
jgi:hypothetical protein